MIYYKYFQSLWTFSPTAEYSLQYREKHSFRPVQTKCPLRAAAAAESLQSCPTLCDPIDGSPSGSPVPGTLQARTLEWVAISFSRA